MQYLKLSPCVLSKFVLTLGLSATGVLGVAPRTWAQDLDGAIASRSGTSAEAATNISEDLDTNLHLPSQPTVLAVPGATTDEVLQRFPALFLENATTSDEPFSTQANDLRPDPLDITSSSIYLANELRLAQDSETGVEPEAGSETEPTPGPAVDDRQLEITVVDKPAFSIGFGSDIDEPTALEGPTRELTVAAESTILSLASLSGHIRQRIGDNQSILVEGVLDPELLGIDISYTVAPESIPGEFSFNFFNQRSLSPSLEGGDDEVDLPDESDPRVHRIGGGVEYSQTITPSLALAGAINYQQVTVRDALFSDDLEDVDEEGNAVIVSDDRRDDLLVLSLVGLYDQVEGEGFSLDGTRVRFGMDQSIPVNEADIFYNRLMANVTQFIPLRIFTGEPGTLVFNVQGGATFGDVPPYQTFNLGGSSTVRGYSKGDVGSGSSFIQATAEYRLPLFSFNAFKQPIGIGGVLFVDYATDLGTDDEVIGDPADARDKPGDGLGYGVGIHGTTPFGLVRFEFGLNDEGGTEFHFAIGDRF